LKLHRYENFVLNDQNALSLDTRHCSHLSSTPILDVAPIWASVTRFFSSKVNWVHHAGGKRASHRIDRYSVAKILVRSHHVQQCQSAIATVGKYECGGDAGPLATSMRRSTLHA